ncbi:MAG TPA: hypothetical protein VD838_12170 [Anaeromyxobacteraceae bacterium]|nr:hypothetical protein [Anaeromyxobacteraceae bacterium]
MAARWASFGVGLWLILAPLALGYGSVGPILHGVALGLLVCIATLAAFEWPWARFALLLPAAWLLRPGRGSGDAEAALAELVSGAALFLLTLVPSARVVHAPRDRAGARV